MHLRMKPKTKTTLADDFNFARLGLGLAAAGIFLSTAYFNISSWVKSAPSLDASIAYGVMSASVELMALCGLAWAGFQASQKRWGRAGLAVSFAVAAIVLNAMAAENFLHLQADGLLNAIEMSGETLSTLTAEITELERQVDSIIQQNGGTIPRPVEAIEAEYSRFDPETNPINMGRKNAEIALRVEYERLQEQLTGLRREAGAAAVASNDTVRTVIPPHMIAAFIWCMEVIKGTVFFALGTANGKKKSTPEHRKKWAIIRAKDGKGRKSKKHYNKKYKSKKRRRPAPT